MTLLSRCAHCQRSATQDELVHCIHCHLSFCRGACHGDFTGLRWLDPVEAKKDAAAEQRNFDATIHAMEVDPDRG